jgi:alkylated DNA nucleotide flippase Atl1
MTRYQRALQIWSLLVCAAKDRRTYTYGDLADTLGMGGAGVMAQFLGPVMHYCQEHQLPPLTVLVVNRDTGQPGSGLTALENVDRDRERVFAHDWFQMEPPETDDFEEATRASSTEEASPAPMTDAGPD